MDRLLLTTKHGTLYSPDAPPSLIHHIIFLQKRKVSMLFSGKGRSYSPVLIFLGLIVLFLPQFAAAQGESAVPFLLIAPNARADGMGEAGTALADDASAAFWNPAGLAFQTGQELSLTHSNWLPAFQQSD